MKSSLKKVCQDLFCAWSLTLCLIFLALGAIFLAFSWSKLPPQIPLFYNRDWGEEQLAQKNQILLLPGLAIVILIFNLFFAVKLYLTQPLLAKILLGLGVVSVFVLTLALAKTIGLVT